MDYKRGIGVIIIFFFLVVPAFAKQKQSPPQQLSSDEIVAKMQTQLQLTDDQIQKVKPIIEDYLVQEQLLKVEEKKALSKVLTGQQLFTWNFLQNEPPKEKKKHAL